MKSIYRIVLGLGVIIGAIMVKLKAAPVPELADDELALLSVFGRPVEPSTLTMLVVGFALIGLVMVVLGVIGLRKKSV